MKLSDLTPEMFENGGEFTLALSGLDLRLLKELVEGTFEDDRTTNTVVVEEDLTIAMRNGLATGFGKRGIRPRVLQSSLRARDPQARAMSEMIATYGEETVRRLSQHLVQEMQDRHRVQTLREWITDLSRLGYADSVDADGKLDYVWRFTSIGGPNDNWFRFRRQYRHSEGEQRTYPGRGWPDPAHVMVALERAGISLDLRVKPTTMY